MPAKLDRCVKKIMGQGKSKSDAFAICQSKQKTSSDIQEIKNWRHVEFCTPISETFLNNEQEFFIKGVAINETTTRNSITYVSEELEKAAPSFRNKPLLVDHENSIFNIVGRTTENVNFERSIEGQGRIMFEAKIMDKKIQEMINDGRITNVSIGAMLEDLREDEEAGTVTAIGIQGLEISLVAIPGDPGAGLANALRESLDLKTKLNMEDFNMAENDGNDVTSEDEQPEITTEPTQEVEEPTPEAKVEEPAEEETTEDTAEEKLKIAEIKLAKYEAKEVAEKFSKAVAIEVKKQLSEQMIPSAKITKISTKNETKGKVNTIVENVNEELDVEIERAEVGKGFSLWKDYSKDENCKFKRLYRG